MAQASAPHGARVSDIVAILLTIAGITALIIGGAGQLSAPQPGAPQSSAEVASEAEAALPVPPPWTGPAPVSAPRAAAPVEVRVPAIGVRSELLELGLDVDGTVAVPPLSDVSRAGWYTGSPVPGEPGPAVLLGHVDSADSGPGVFFALGALDPGEEVYVSRADGTVAIFTVERVARYPKSGFPTHQVYGNTAGPELRLITCGGAFDSSLRSYEDNIVVYAVLTDIRAN